MFSAVIQGRKDRTIISPKDSKVMSYKITQLAREIMEIKERKKKTNKTQLKNNCWVLLYLPLLPGLLECI